MPSFCLLQAFIEMCLPLYRELHKATSNFTALLGQGAFGPVYKAVLPTIGTTLAVKVLAEQSKQGDREFQNEVCSASALV